jgi:hypothetical protein
MCFYFLVPNYFLTFYYETKNITTMKMHKLNSHSDSDSDSDSDSNKEKREKEFKYYCKECVNGCFFYKEMINKHNETTKHKYNM